MVRITRLKNTLNLSWDSTTVKCLTNTEPSIGDNFCGEVSHVDQDAYVFYIRMDRILTRRLGEVAQDMYQIYRCLIGISAMRVISRYGNSSCY